MKLNLVLILFLVVSNTAKLKESIKYDETLVVPGLGAERVLLKESITLTLKTYIGSKYKFSKPKKRSELFNDIFGVNSEYKIYFDSIYFFEDKSVILFILNSKAVAVAGLKSRITIDSVDIGKGADFFIFSYGNKNLKIIEKGNNKLYIYSKKGIAVVDDDSDDKIDMYIVFIPSN